ncbi:MAG: hypothetical protein PVJ43_10810 [Gemmatimonadales bacterium]
MSFRASVAAVVGILIVVGAAHLMLAPNVADLDSFYHLGHAAHYAATTPFDTAFPWARFSAIRDLGADLWWGFHLLLLPFTGFTDLVDGIRVAGVVLSVSLLGAVLWICRRHRLVDPWLWPILFFVAVPSVLYRYVMVRPHVVSLLATLLLLSFLARGRWWQVLLASAVITWSHLSLFWLAPTVVLAFLAGRALDRWLVAASPPSGDEKALPAGLAVGSVVAGTAVGWLFRPHPIAAARLADIQVLRLFREQAADLPLAFAQELRPLPLAAFGWTAWFLLPLWAGAIVILAWSLARKRRALSEIPAPERTLLWGSTVLSAAFLGLTMAAAGRALVEWAAFGIVSVSFVATYLLGEPVLRRTTVRVLALITLLVTPWIFHEHRVNVRLNAVAPDHLQEAATWLADHSQPGDVVFHAHWDNFGPLFARNRVNHYLGGMDPIFQYVHDRGLYWRYAYLSTDLATEWTCDAYPCREGGAVDTYASLVGDFDARWVLVESERNPKLFFYFLNDARYDMGLLTENAAVFEVLRPSAASTPDVAAAAGTYRATTFTMEEAGVVTDWLARGASIDLTLYADGTAAGRLFVPGGGRAGSDFDEDLTGSWSLTGATLELDHAAETFLREMQLGVAGSRLTGAETFGSVTVGVVLSKSRPLR